MVGQSGTGNQPRVVVKEGYQGCTVGCGLRLLVPTRCEPLKTGHLGRRRRGYSNTLLTGLRLYITPKKTHQRIGALRRGKIQRPFLADSLSNQEVETGIRGDLKVRSTQKAIREAK